jgi:hypothetical protein
MADVKIGYYKGEDHQGRPMTAYQRGPADPDIVGKMFGMKNVQEINKAEYDRLNSPEPAEVEKPATPPANGTREPEEMNEYGDEATEPSEPVNETTETVNDAPTHEDAPEDEPAPEPEAPKPSKSRKGAKPKAGTEGKAK